MNGIVSKRSQASSERGSAVVAAEFVAEWRTEDGGKDGGLSVLTVRWDRERPTVVLVSTAF